MKNNSDILSETAVAEGPQLWSGERIEIPSLKKLNLPTYTTGLSLIDSMVLTGVLLESYPKTQETFVSIHNISSNEEISGKELLERLGTLEMIMECVLTPSQVNFAYSCSKRARAIVLMNGYHYGVNARKSGSGNDMKAIIVFEINKGNEGISIKQRGTIHLVPRRLMVGWSDLDNFKNFSLIIKSPEDLFPKI